MALRSKLRFGLKGPRNVVRDTWHSLISRVLLLASAFSLVANLLILPLRGQVVPPQYVTRVWHTEEGLPQNSVNAMLQDHSGYIWIGTFGGLARFDGERFTVFDSSNTPGFGSDQIFALYEDRSGVLWIGTVDGGLVRLEDGVATRYTERDGLPNRWVTSIHGDLEGRVWINTAEGGVAQYSGAKLHPCSTYRGKPVREFFLQARDGSMWFRSGQEVVRFAPDGSVAALHSSTPTVFLVQEDRDGSVWIAFRDQYRLVRYHQGAFMDLRLPSLGRRRLMRNALLYSFGMTQDANGNLLLRTPAGLVHIVDGTLGAPELLPLPADPGELLKVRSLLVDREGNLWVGTIGRGLIRLRRAPLTAYGKGEGLSDSNFSSVFQDQEGRIWLGGDSLYWFDGHRFHRFQGLTDILSIAQTRNGDMWFGGYAGLYRLRSGVLSHFDVNAPAVKIIFQDREDTLWIGAITEERPGVLFRFHDGKLEQVPGVSDVRAIVEDPKGGLWLGGLAGLTYMRGNKILTYDTKQGLSSNSVFDLHQDSTGTLWIATYGGGVNRFREGRFKAITTQDGLPDNLLLGLLEDGKGNLWFSSNQSVFRLSLKELNDFADGKTSLLSPVSYGAAEGMRSTESNGGSPGGWIAHDGRIWFPTLRGVVAIDPNAGNRLPPPVVLEQAWANKFKLAGNERTSIPPGTDIFDFRFTALSFSAPEKLHFMYRLEPFDKQWVDAGRHRTAHYTNMSPGEYSFHVIAANNFGVWSTQEASVDFVLLPHFYETNWFRALCAIIVTALLWAIYQQRVRQLHHQFDIALEARVGERTRIARDLHDTLLQSFQGLVLRFQAARYQLPDYPEAASDALDDALISADQAIAEGRSAIQELRSGSSGESNLEQMLLAMGRELASSQGSGDRTPPLRVIVEGQRRAERAMITEEIYRIAQELLRNAYRHARARSIEAELRYDDHAFLLIVRDDGKGIDSNVLKARGRVGHWGLPGIYERAEGIGARLEIWSEAGAGTEVRLTVPAAIAYEKSADRARLKLFRR